MNAEIINAIRQRHQAVTEELQALDTLLKIYNIPKLTVTHVKKQLAPEKTTTSKQRGTAPRSPEYMMDIVDRVNKQISSGKSIEAACSIVGISNPTYYSYRKKVGSGESKIARAKKENGDKKYLSDKELREISTIA